MQEMRKRRCANAAHSQPNGLHSCSMLDPCNCTELWGSTVGILARKDVRQRDPTKQNSTTRSDHQQLSQPVSATDLCFMLPFHHNTNSTMEQLIIWIGPEAEQKRTLST
eukprot:5613747-Amphidinium_carterae.1